MENENGNISKSTRNQETRSEKSSSQKTRSQESSSQTGSEKSSRQETGSQKSSRKKTGSQTGSKKGGSQETGSQGSWQRYSGRVVLLRKGRLFFSPPLLYPAFFPPTHLSVGAIVKQDVVRMNSHLQKQRRPLRTIRV